MRKVSDHQWEMRARGPVALNPVRSANTVELDEKWDVRLRCVKPKMPIVCKALEIERWRWRAWWRRLLVNLDSARTYLFIAVTIPQGLNTLRLVSIQKVIKEGMILLLRSRMYTTLTSPTFLEAQTKVG